MSRLAPFLIGFAIVGSVVGMAIYAIMIAPWANIYAQLTAEPDTRAPEAA
jgi:preprotein translocase subunit SecY